MDPHDGFETELQAEPGAPVRQVMRRRPQVAWTDAQGAHLVALDARALVGSAPDAEIRVADGTVSRLHAELDPRADGVWIRDLGSRNGTFIEGIMVSTGRVPEGGRVRLGATTLTVDYAKAPATVDLWPDQHFGPLLGRSAAMRELFARLARVAQTDATVLIHGETGTGKELVAQAIHEAGPRADGPFAIVDCAALAESVLESELFGHARGAFTGAVAARAGAIESADGGTVFLDEIGELPLAMQPKLLRVLESRTVRRLGETQHRKVDVRFVTATHRDLRRMINAGGFREDLFFRLAVVPVTVPPLRARLDDVPLLVSHFVPAGAKPGLAAELARRLTSRQWLGNVRELRNVVERAATLGIDDALSDDPGGDAPRIAPPRVAASAGDDALPPVPLDRPFKDLRERWIDHLEREYIGGLLARFDRSATAVASAAGLTRAYVHRLARKHGL